MSRTRGFLALLAAAVVGAAIVLGWTDVRSEAAELRSRITESALDPVARLLERNQALIGELQSGLDVEPDAGIVGAYLAKIRRDGLPKHATMKKRLEELADNQLRVVALLEAYMPIAQTPALAAAATQFRETSRTWRERWNTTMELFMAGGNLPEAEIPKHGELLTAVLTERATALRPAQ